MSLQELATKDKLWRKVAYQICGNKSLADDLVQDMYLKLCNVDKEIKDCYVMLTLRSLFIDLKRKEREQIDFSTLLDYSDESEYDFNRDQLATDLLNEVDSLKWFEREVLRLTTTEISQNELSRQTGIRKATINKTVKEAKQKIWQKVEEKKPLQD